MVVSTVVLAMISCTPFSLVIFNNLFRLEGLVKSSVDVVKRKGDGAGRYEAVHFVISGQDALVKGHSPCILFYFSRENQVIVTSQQDKDLTIVVIGRGAFD